MRLLLVSTNDWPSAGKLALALIRVGFQVAAVCPANSPVHQIKKLHARFYYRFWRPLASLQSAIAEWSPDLLICTDDVAVGKLHCLHSKAAKRPKRPMNKELMALIELSLGSAVTFETTRSKSAMILLARSLGIRCPPTVVCRSGYAVEQGLQCMVYPILIKADGDGSWGGRGVRLAKNREELLAAVAELLVPIGWRQSIKRLIGPIVYRLFFCWSPWWPRNLSIQQYIVGHPCNRAVVCWKGKVVAGISVEALATLHQFGPTGVAKIISNREMEAAAHKIVNKLALTGFLGFDFVLDHDKKAWLLEMNPRATPTCHLCIKKPSLPASLFSAVTGSEPDSEIRVLQHKTIALFPTELSEISCIIDPSISICSDVPDEEPQFVDACRMPDTGLFKMLGNGKKAKVNTH